MANKAKVAEVAEFDMSAYPTKSAAIRALSGQGKTRSEIAKLLNIRYQHVRNVLTQPLKKAQ